MRIERESPEGRWLRTRWDGILAMAPIGADYTRWIVTGIAAIIAVILASVDSVSKHVSIGCFRWGTGILVISLLSGAVAYLISLSLAAGVESRKRAEKAAENEEPAVTPELLESFKSAFWGPLRWIVNRALRKATADPLHVEKSQISTVCLLNLLILGTVALAGVGMIVLVVGLTAGVPAVRSEPAFGQKPNQSLQHNAGSRPSSGDSPVRNSIVARPAWLI